MKIRTHKITMIAMLCAIAYVVMAATRPIPSFMPTASFLKYDPKDIIIVIGGFIFGPLAAFLVSLLVSIVEMFTVSTTGPIGCVMNILSSCAFACTASFIYKKKHTVSGAVIGLFSGCLITTGVMLLWNYFLTPIYQGWPREAVAAMLVPVFLPFNLIKSGINAGITLLIYKPVVNTLRKARLIDIPENRTEGGNKFSIFLIGAFLLATGVVFALIISGKL
jgi:riboflavin transporter FmnP